MFGSKVDSIIARVVGAVQSGSMPLLEKAATDSAKEVVHGMLERMYKTPTTSGCVRKFVQHTRETIMHRHPMRYF